MSPARQILFNHLGRLIENVRRDRDAELLGRFQVDDQIKFYGLLHGKVANTLSYGVG